MIRLTTFRWVPSFAQGYVRDLGVRWALEEAGLPYELRLIGRDEASSPEYRKHSQPFGQVPVLEDGDVTLFESGSIVQYIGEKSDVLLPSEKTARARARTWVISALNSIDPFVRDFNLANNAAESGEGWGQQRRPGSLANLRRRLGDLNTWMQKRHYLEDRFSVGDIVMTIVLRNLDGSGVLDEFENLVQHRERCEARPAFRKALADQIKTCADNAPKT